MGFILSRNLSRNQTLKTAFSRMRLKDLLELSRNLNKPRRLKLKTNITLDRVLQRKSISHLGRLKDYGEKYLLLRWVVL